MRRLSSHAARCFGSRSSWPVMSLVAGLALTQACKTQPQPPPPGEHPDGITPVVAKQAKDQAAKNQGRTLRVPVSPLGNNKVSGAIIFTELADGAGVQLDGIVTGLTPGKHGMHVHDKPDCSGPEGLAAGSHFNPTEAPHGDLEEAKSHAGDLGNIEADADGKAVFHLVKKGATLGAEQASFVGHSIMIHADSDDLTAQPAGESGHRIACGVIAAGGR